jgi:hypothetical protein
MMDNSFDSFWKDLMKLRYPALDKQFIFNCNLELEGIVPINNKVRQDLNKYFFELKFWDEFNQESMIWFNSHLKLEGKTIFYKERYILIRDLLNDNNIFKTLDEVKDQYDCRINYILLRIYILASFQ